MFEGKEIKIIMQDGKKHNAIVVACVKGIGITIVKKSDKERILCCLRMQNAPNFINKRGQIKETNKIFTLVRKGIISGIVNTRKVSFSATHRVGFIPASACAFNQ